MKQEITIVRYPDGTIDKVLVKNASIIFPNFNGTPDDIHFNFEIEDPDMATLLSNEGFNVRIWLDKRDPDAKPIHLLKVTIRYRNKDGSLKFEKYLPKTHMVVDGVDTLLDEDNVKELQGCTIKYAHLTFTPYNWEYNGRNGVAARLKTGYFVCESVDEWAYLFENHDGSDESLPFA